MSEQKNDPSGWVDSVLGQMGLVFHLRGLVGVLDYSFRRAALHQEEQKLREMLEARAALSAPAVPEGWKLVPIEPTAKMIQAAGHKWVTNTTVYRAMLAAAPSPQEQTP